MRFIRLAPMPVRKASANDRVTKTYSVYFLKVAVPSDAGISFGLDPIVAEPYLFALSIAMVNLLVDELRP